MELQVPELALKTLHRRSDPWMRGTAPQCSSPLLTSLIGAVGNLSWYVPTYGWMDCLLSSASRSSEPKADTYIALATIA